MKKILLLHLFVFSFSVYSQPPPGLLSPYSLCDNDANPNDGYTSFDLQSTNPIGSLGLNPAIYSITFHPSVVDATNNVNVILNPSAYTNVISNYQIIGVRFLNSSNNEVNVSGMELIVNQSTIPNFITPSPICIGQNIMALPTVSNNGITGTWTPSTIDNTVTSIYTFTPDIGQCAATVTITIPVYNCNTQATCGGIFTDSGGPSVNYSNNSNQTTTICPTVPGDTVVVTFTAFNTETNRDALYVYNGVNVIPSQQILSANASGNVPGGLAGGYWGNTIPGPFTSTTIDGCLTFVFRSDTVDTSEGWIANVNCLPAQCEAPTVLTVSSITNTSAALNWANPSGATSWEIEIVAVGGTPTGVGTVYSGPLPYVVTGLTQDQCYDVYVRAICSIIPSEWSNTVNFCMYNCENNASCAESLVLIAFIDTNANGIKDSGEVNCNYGNFIYQINDSGMNLYGNSNNGSYYIFDANPSNSYDISFVVNTALGAYYTSSVSHNNITLPSGSGATTLYFPIVNILPHVDARVSLYPSGQPRPGFTYENIIAYQNYGSQTIANGTLIFTKNSNLSITSISQAGTTPTSTGFTYDFTNLTPFETRFIYVTLTVPTIPTVNLGDLLTNTVSVQINNDADLTNNVATLSQIVVGSYDPNDKSESHGGRIGLDTFTNNDYLYYTINFENTGTASAEFVRLEDTLDARLDESTFEMINASHSVNTKREGNQLTWNFRTINLPPTITNPNDSHGYVYFRIKPTAGYVVGDIIPNTASIYFDYNPAIVTNTFNTEFFQTLGTTSFSNSEFLLYPNPAKSIVHITQNSNQSIENIQFYDVAGKTVKIISNVSNYQTSVDISALAKGIYFVEITSENNIKQTKKLIIQ
jgi:Secretion system C-terminal sorting domain